MFKIILENFKAIRIFVEGSGKVLVVFRVFWYFQNYTTIRLLMAIIKEKFSILKASGNLKH